MPKKKSTLTPVNYNIYGGGFGKKKSSLGAVNDEIPQFNLGPKFGGGVGIKSRSPAPPQKRA